MHQLIILDLFLFVGYLPWEFYKIVVFVILLKFLTKKNENMSGWVKGITEEFMILNEFAILLGVFRDHLFDNPSEGRTIDSPEITFNNRFARSTSRRTIQ